MGALIWTIMALSCVLGVRNHLVFKYRMRRLDEIHTFCLRSIAFDQIDCMPEIDRRYDEIDNPSYNMMVFDITKWTYRQFYPKPVE